MTTEGNARPSLREMQTTILLAVLIFQALYLLLRQAGMGWNLAVWW